MEDKNEDEYSHGANGKIDIKAPSPRHFCREGSAQQRSNDGRKTEDSTQWSLYKRSFVKGNEVHHDDDCSREDARGAGTSYCATNDEGSGIGSSPTYCGSDFKDADSPEEDPFGVVESVNSTHDELEGASSEHVSAGVPANVVE